MPLPVERSQGSVSSLVARFQTAANRDAEQARRQSLPPPRRSSGNTFVRAEPASAETEAAPRKEAEAKPTATASVSAPVPASANGPSHETASTPGSGQPHDGDGGKGKIKSLKEKGESLVDGLKDLAVGGGASAKDANEAMAKEVQAKPTASPAKPSPPRAAAKDETVEGKAAQKNGTIHTPTTAKQAKTASTPTKTPKVSTSSPAAKLAAVGPAPSASSTRPRVSTSAKPATPAPKSPIQVKRPTASAKNPSPTSKSPTTAKTAEPALSAKPSPAPAQRLTPALTGPARRTSSSHPIHPEPTPLKPHLTGTPSKPTASSLAKTRTPSSSSAHERRESSSLGRTTGTTASARARLSSASPSPASSTVKSPSARSTISASTSRLLQGTAASRAKAADVKSPPPKSVPKGTTRTPTKKANNDSRSEVGHAGSEGPTHAPPGLRVGFAAAGVGKGGKTGKAFNDEQNDKLLKGEVSGEEIVRLADEPPRNGAAAVAQVDGEENAAGPEGDAAAIEAAQSHIDTTDPTATVDSELRSTHKTRDDAASDVVQNTAAAGSTETSTIPVESESQHVQKDSPSDTVEEQPEPRGKEANLEEIPDL